ncbi:8-amino-7-oxononanoate synthase [Chryseobacterium lactis]|uniref:8-amino-7-oxononanoate synthase n=1 Tax=Chryseobacterium lactis TaxID=1241981 RepID=A0A3G6RIH1_CHRLC|nr:aminotransferase class I/II-fold pyridoxal phosphate-dependent enzyme [Chryseobacterium lactis]AZA83633.1 aminotransferase class I/II-fold pyridoxal phosphate-dependent enzyme [Chryseobacterium lactis]AZB04018.1 aminotransferase class I/II-fold pyridoxal phosphate-dependent enzyme [Chryseobacterium lactis]PNW13073.1 8-amino-7-oxononanoate synthase [Chryseobacterium lactis]
MPDHHHRFQQLLCKRKEEGILRSLNPRSEGIDFYSNDYLGFAGNKQLQDILLQTVISNPQLLSGSTGSRLISGNTAIANDTELYIAEKHRFQAALLFPSGYNANLALFSTLPGRHDTIIVDEQIHRSVHDACRMSNARKLKFRHNDPEDLDRILKKQDGHCYIAIESLYSMEGDFAPVEEIAELAEQYGANLIIDEAHAFGVFGYGLVEKYQLQDKVCAAVMTYGKALGAHGAAVLSNHLIRSYLINFASAFIYTTSAQDIQWMSIRTGYDFLEDHPESAKKLHENITIFRNQNLKSPSSATSPVQAIVIADNQKLKTIQNTLSDNGFLTYAVYSPTVKEGTERLRICLHSFNTEEEIVRLAEIIKQII